MGASAVARGYKELCDPYLMGDKYFCEINEKSGGLPSTNLYYRLDSSYSCVWKSTGEVETISR